MALSKIEMELERIHKRHTDMEEKLLAMEVDLEKRVKALEQRTFGAAQILPTVITTGTFGCVPPIVVETESEHSAKGAKVKIGGTTNVESVLPTSKTRLSGRRKNEKQRGRGRVRK